MQSIERKDACQYSPVLAPSNIDEIHPITTIFEIKKPSSSTEIASRVDN